MSIIINILFMLFLYKITTHDMCHNVFMMMKEIRIPIHKQIVQLNIYQMHMEV
jgi:hypothetical protein